MGFGYGDQGPIRARVEVEVQPDLVECLDGLAVWYQSRGLERVVELENIRNARSVEIELKHEKWRRDYTFRLVATIQEGEESIMSVSSPPSRLVVTSCQKKPSGLNINASIEQISTGEFLSGAS